VSVSRITLHMKGAPAIAVGAFFMPKISPVATPSTTYAQSQAIIGRVQRLGMPCQWSHPLFPRLAHRQAGKTRRRAMRDSG